MSRQPLSQGGAATHQVGAMVNNLQRAIVLDRLTSDGEADDPNDTFLLGLSIAGDADYLVANGLGPSFHL